LLPFLAGATIVGAIAAAVWVIRDDGGTEATRTPRPTAGPYPLLEDGEYIDSLPSDLDTLGSGLEAVPITYGASITNSIAVMRFEEVVETIFPTIGPGTRTPTDSRFRPVPWTTYRVTVEEWLKGGDGSAETTLTIIGGVELEEPRLLTGTFLPQLGRTYLLTMDLDTAETPGTSTYIAAMAGWSAFEVGEDGAIHVLNEANSRRVMGAWNLTPVGDFIERVREWIVAAPEVTPTPPPSASPEGGG
jgi:hypothetical protein